MGKKHQITRAAELESLSAFREFIEAACQQHPGIDKQLRYDLKLAVDEACTNIITHGYAGMDPGSIILALTPLVTFLLALAHGIESFRLRWLIGAMPACPVRSRLGYDP